MRLFSHRKKLKPLEKAIQINELDRETRNRLWNMLKFHYWDRMLDDYIIQNPIMENFLNKIWHDYFKESLDTLNNYWRTTYNQLISRFDNFDWNEVYDFIEFVVNTYPDKSINERFKDACNKILKQEFSAYCFVDGKITEITSEEEIDEIEKALETPIKPVKEHLKRSLDLLADRKSPDYRNSIKESISSVEAICKLITNKPNATLDKALDEIEREGKVKIHPALKGAFGRLYGYTSSADGIRHALMDKPDLDFEDAKFMLVSCSAFINYLIVKSGKAGLNLS